jgi:polyhydroxyalkanoate synthase
MSKEPRLEPDLAGTLTDQAARSTLALNPLVGLRSQDLCDAAATLVKAVTYDPNTAAKQWLWFVGELGKIVTGQSERASQAGDRRFVDPAWKSSKLHRSLLQAYLAWGSAVGTFVDQCSLSELDKTRARLITSIIVDALAPTNALLTNPAALKQLVESGGESPVAGVQELCRRPRAERRAAVSGPEVSVQNWGEPGPHARRRGVPQSRRRAHPVCLNDVQRAQATTGHHSAAN